MTVPANYGTEYKTFPERLLYGLPFVELVKKITASERGAPPGKKKGLISDD